MYKHKIDLPPDLSIDIILEKIKEKYPNYPLITIDGIKIKIEIKIEMDNSWVHLRKSNTEAVLRVYAEAITYERAKYIALEISTLVV
tara:strand:+ start:13555 stop:13815 length:261 start_codon:yes stop_codon:yes gene_type:complete